MSKDSKKKEITDVVMQYVKDGVFDISGFRKDHSNIYATLPYYFGGINGMLDQLGLVKVQKSQQKNKVTLRNRLAYDMLVELRKSNTLEQIAKMYGVSRALINQQYQALELAIKVEELEKEKHNAAIQETAIDTEE